MIPCVLSLVKQDINIITTMISLQFQLSNLSFYSPSTLFSLLTISWIIITLVITVICKEHVILFISLSLVLHLYCDYSFILLFYFSSDLKTQWGYQQMDDRFVGIIFSVFNKPNNKGVRLQFFCYIFHQLVFMKCIFSGNVKPWNINSISHSKMAFQCTSQQICQYYK